MHVTGPTMRRLGAAAAAAATALLVLAATPGTAAAESTVRGLWHFDEASGDVAHDSSGHGNNGVVYGATIGEPGRFGTAYEFGGANARVEVPSSADLNPGASDFEFSAWVNFTVAPGSGVTYDIVRKGLTTTKGGDYKLEIFTGGKARCIAKDTNKVRAAIQSRGNLADGNWHQVGCRRNGAAWSVIVDGRAYSKNVGGLGSISNTKALSIGSKYGSEDGTPGRIDEVQFSVG